MSKVTIHSPAMKRILRVLEHCGPLNNYQISDLALVGFQTFQNTYRKILVESGLIHVGSWERSPGSGPYRPIFHFGPGETAPQPSKKDRNLQVREWRERVGYYQTIRANNRLKSVDSTTAALLGIK